MAYIGLRKPIVYPFDPVNSGKYLDGVPFGKAVSFSMSPNIAEASFYGDDILAESEKAVTSATLSLGTTDVPDNCKKLMFGHKEGDSGELLTKNTLTMSMTTLHMSASLSLV